MVEVRALNLWAMESTWEGLAGAVEIAASSSNIIGVNILLAMKEAVGGLGAFVLATAIILDLIVLAISIVHWATQLPVLGGMAPIFELVGFSVALAANLQGVDEIEDYADAALLIASVGLGAATADYELSQ